MTSIGNVIHLIFPWSKMKLIDHQREILLLCFDRQSKNEILVHFDKNGRIQRIETSPKIFLKCFHQQSSLYRPDILYEIRSLSIEPHSYRSYVFQHEKLLDPTQPLTLPLQPNMIPILSYSRIANIFEYDHIQVHTIRNYSPIHYKNEDFYQIRSTLGYFDEVEQQNSVEIHFSIAEHNQLDQQKLRSLMSLAGELSQMFEII